MTPEQVESERTENRCREAIDVRLDLHVARGNQPSAEEEGKRGVEHDFDQEVVDDDHEAVRGTKPVREDGDENGSCKEDGLRVEQADEEAQGKGMPGGFPHASTREDAFLHMRYTR